MDPASMLIFFGAFAVIGFCTEIILGFDTLMMLSTLGVALLLTIVIAHFSETTTKRLSISTFQNTLGILFVESVLPMAVGAFIGVFVSKTLKSILRLS